MKLTLEKKVTIGFGAGLLVLVLTGGVSFWSAVQTIEAFRLVDHTQQVFTRLESILVHLLTMETGERGYVISGNESFLEPLGGGTAAIDKALKELKQLIADNPRQVKNLAQLEPVIREKEERMQARIQERQKAGFTEAAGAFAGGEGKRVMDECRKQIQRMENIEEALLEVRSRNARWLAWETVLILLFSVILSVLLALTALARLNRDFALRRRAEESLQKSSQELEQALHENRRIMAELQQRAASLEAANGELEAFSYSVSHDLRAPLRHIEGFVALLEKNCQEQVNEKMSRYVNIIGGATRKMGSLIDDLLTFSRLGRTDLRAQTVRLNDLVDEARAELKSEVSGREIAWEIARLPTVKADAALLRQVFINLLGNAVKYTRRQENARIEISSQPPGNGEVVVYVRDNGAGFDEQYTHKLFGVFQRLHTEADFEGTGIGLAIVRRVVSRHGGRTWAEGKIGAGATFYMSLPLTGTPA